MAIKVGFEGYGQRAKVFDQRLAEVESLKDRYELIGIRDVNSNIKEELLKINLH